MSTPIGSAAQLHAAPAAANDDACTQLAVTQVRPEERISALDTIRGFALLGILLMNIASFGLHHGSTSHTPNFATAPSNRKPSPSQAR